MNETPLEPRASHVALCVEFLSQCEPTSRATSGSVFLGTYGLKHIIERWAGDYILEQECVLAARQLGLVLVELWSEGSYGVGLTQKSVARMGNQRRSR